MKYNCNVIRDLLPLYADDACSEESRAVVDEHLQECADCGNVLARLRENEIETDLQSEKKDVLQYGARKFRRRSATVGSAVSGLFMVPILICLLINIFSGFSMGWFLIVLASLAVPAALIVVPLTVPENKAFWTFCAFTASVILLLGVIALVSGGSWYWIASSAVLFGLGVIFLPFVIKAKPLRPWVGNRNKLLLVLAADGILFLNMMSAISMSQQSTFKSILMTIGVAAGVALITLEIMRRKGMRND